VGAPPAVAGDMTRIIKLLYPKAPSYRIRHHVRATYVALAIGLFAALVVSGLIYWYYQSDRFWR